MSVFRRIHKKKLLRSSKGKTGNSATFKALVEELSKESSEAADALGRMEDKRAIPHLKRQLWN